ncbi:MAG: Clp protease ClpP, partial [Clostridiales Family XIII bacterium]|nr:Clp protease ClpP [Clostridiales Family XIII bacterium]
MSKRFAGKKAVSIKREFYTMATVNGDEAEIVMYGNIVSRRPVDWWTDEPIDGDFIILSEFLK